MQASYQHRQAKEVANRSDLIRGLPTDEPCSTNTLVLDEAERVVVVKGCYTESAITRLYMLTNKGKYIECGANEGKKFAWEFRGKQYFLGFKATAQRWINFLLPLKLERIPDVQIATMRNCDVPNIIKPGNYLQRKPSVDPVYKSRQCGCPLTAGAAFDDFFDLNLHAAAAENKLQIVSIECTSLHW